LTWIILGVAVIAAVLVAWFALSSRANSILLRRSQDLAKATGLPAEQIYREMRDRGLTPGGWAVEHGLDPMTLRRP
jgi:hypothetical protein